MNMRLAKTVWQDSQSLFHPPHVRVAQVFESGQKARVEKDDGFSHVSVFR